MRGSLLQLVDNQRVAAVYTHHPISCTALGSSAVERFPSVIVSGGFIMRSLRSVSIVVFSLLLVSGVARAQGTAQLDGTVRDESGGVLPGVTVTMTQTDTGVMRSAVTEANGSYVLPNLPLGPYKLEVTLQGFRTHVQNGIVLQVGGMPTINVILAVGNLQETVSVEGAAPLVDVRTSGIRE